MRIVMVAALLAFVFTAAIVMRRPPEAPHREDAVELVILVAHITELQQELQELDRRVDGAFQILLDNPVEDHERAELKLRELQQELAAAKRRVAVAKAEYAKVHCPY